MVFTRARKRFHYINSSLDGTILNLGFQVLLKVEASWDWQNLTFQKYFSSRYWTNFFHQIKLSRFLWPACCACKNYQLTSFSLSTNHTSEYSLTFLVPCIGNSNYVFVGLLQSLPQAKNSEDSACLKWHRSLKQFRGGVQFQRLDSAYKTRILNTK